MSLEAPILNIDSTFFSRKKSVSPDNVFLFETLHLTPRSRIWLKQAVILSSTSSFFATIAAFCTNLRSQVKNVTDVYVYLLDHSL